MFYGIDPVALQTNAKTVSLTEMSTSGATTFSTTKLVRMTFSTMINYVYEIVTNILVANIISLCNFCLSNS